MKDVPNYDHLKTLPPDEQAYWRGYFQGFAAGEINCERRCSAQKGMGVGDRIRTLQHLSSEDRDTYSKLYDRNDREAFLQAVWRRRPESPKHGK